MFSNDGVPTEDCPLDPHQRSEDLDHLLPHLTSRQGDLRAGPLTHLEETTDGAGLEQSKCWLQVVQASRQESVGEPHQAPDILVRHGLFAGQSDSQELLTNSELPLPALQDLG